MLKGFFVGLYSDFTRKNILKETRHAVEEQKALMSHIIARGQKTLFGKEHNFNQIKTYDDFTANVPIRDYEDLRSYIEKIKNGESDILWPGKPKYFAKTSGTTSGVKYIPITRESTSNHIKTAQKAVLNYMAQNKGSALIDGKLIFLSGSPVMNDVGGIPTGRLSGIVNHEVPAYLRSNQVPSYETNCIEDWEQKLDAIVQETYDQDLRMISGIPPWVQMYFEALLKQTGKKSIKEVFPNLELFVYGGVNYEPYRQSIETLIGDSISTLELYPASEGFIAFQDTLENQGLLLNTSSGIFYEFVEIAELSKEYPKRIMLEDVSLDTEYALIISSNAGLWGYNIGDTVRFVSLDPYRMVVTGRIKHFISAFGEHVIAKEVDDTIALISAKYSWSISEYTVAPHVTPQGTDLPHHEWFIEMDSVPDNLVDIASEMDTILREKNIYYDDLIRGKILEPLHIQPLKKGTFARYMEANGKLGGQNKVPRLSNDRKLVDELVKFNI